MRFLSHKLDLDEDQVAEVAALLDTLKTERAQAAVDDRRARSAFAGAIGDDAFDVEAATAAGEARAQTAARLNQAVVDALKALHGLLEADQRKKLAVLLRAGTLEI